MQRGSMTFKEAGDIVDKIRYKPNVQVTFLRYRHGDLAELKIFTMVNDVDATDKIIHVVQSRTMDLDRIETEVQLLQFIHKAFVDFEIHELNEWFRYDGNKPFDPHKEEV